MNALRQEIIDVDKLAQETAARIRLLDDASVPILRPIRRELSKRMARAEPEQVVELAFRLIDRSLPSWFAYELVNHHRAALGSLDAHTLERLGRGIDSWDTVDPFATYLAGPVWRERQVPDSLIHGWARSESRWWRRAALASTVALSIRARGGTGDAPRTLEVCRMLVADHDDMVVKALSWALRALVKRDPEAVRQFLDEYEDPLAARVKRETRNKLRTGLKNPASG